MKYILVLVSVVLCSCGCITTSDPVVSQIKLDKIRSEKDINDFEIVDLAIVDGDSTKYIKVIKTKDGNFMLDKTDVIIKYEMLIK